MTDQTSKPVQRPLIDFSAIPIVEKPEPPTRWYYITRRVNQEMLHYISRDGTPVWCEHDTRNIQPMVFNTKREAQRVAQKHGGTDTPRWYWLVKNRG